MSDCNFCLPKKFTRTYNHNHDCTRRPSNRTCGYNGTVIVLFVSDYRCTYNQLLYMRVGENSSHVVQVQSRLYVAANIHVYMGNQRLYVPSKSHVYVQSVVHCACLGNYTRSRCVCDSSCYIVPAVFVFQATSRDGLPVSRSSDSC